MDIIFQSGEFYGQNSSFWVKIVGAILGAAISGLIAIWIFKKGLSKQQEKELKEKKERFNELESSFFVLIKFLNHGIDIQCTLISENTELLKDLGNNNWRLRFAPEFSTEDFYRIKNEDLFKIFVSHRIGSDDHKSEDFINVKNCFRHIDQLKELLQANEIF